MAVYTELSAVNSILRAANLPPVTAVPGTNDGSDAAMAVEVLNEANALEQSKGWPSNTRKAVLVESDGNGKIFFDATVLNVHCVAPGRYQGEVTVNNAQAYIASEGTDTFAATADFYFDIIVELPFEEAPIDLQWVVVEAARKRYVLERFRNPIMDQLMESDKQQADAYADRHSVDRRGIPKNLSPMPASRGGEGQR